MITDERDLAYEPGANWSSKDGGRHVVIVSASRSDRGCEFVIRNAVTGRQSRIEIAGLDRKFRFAGYDPAYSARMRYSQRAQKD